MKLKGIVIGTPAASDLVPEEDEEVFPEDISSALPAADFPLASLSEEKQLALALKASIDTVRKNKQPVRLALFSTDQPICCFIIPFCFVL